MLNDKRLWRVRVCLLVSTLLLVATRAEAGWFGDEVRSVPLDPGYSMMPRLFGDVDGDRRADYCRFVGERNAAFFSCELAANNYAGRSFAGPVDTTVYQPDNGAFAQLADVTGDGRVDLCTAKVNGDLVWVACFTNPTDSGAWRRLLVQWVSNVSGEDPMWSLRTPTPTVEPTSAGFGPTRIVARPGRSATSTTAATSAAGSSSVPGLTWAIAGVRDSGEM